MHKLVLNHLKMKWLLCSVFLLQTMLLSPQAERNWESLCSMLEDVLEEQSHRQLFALELGSGTGQHVIRFAQKMPFVTWQPSDITEQSHTRFVVKRISYMSNTKVYELFWDGNLVLNLGTSLQYKGLHCCYLCKNCAATCSPGCQWTLGEMGRLNSQLLWCYCCHQLATVQLLQNSTGWSAPQKKTFRH